VKASHKTRLFLITSAAVAVILALLFAGIVFAVQRQVVAHKESEMRLAFQTSLGGDLSTFPLAQFRQNYPGYSVSIYDRSGSLLRHSGPLEAPSFSGFRLGDEVVYLGQDLDSIRVVIASGWTSAEQGLDALASILAGLWLPLSLLVGAATWLGAHSVFRPLERMSIQAAAIRGSDLTERLAIQDRAEFGAFAEELNRMLDSIQETVEREEQFASDAAHELRTPLAILRTRIETTLLRERNPSEYVEALQAMIVEIDRLTLTIETLLRSARVMVAKADPCALQPIVLEAVERYQGPFRERGVKLESDVRPAIGVILPEELSSILGNLLENALRFSPGGSAVTVALWSTNGFAELSVQDQGSGVPPGMEDKIFERFARADDSRNRTTGGAGIGLAVCRRIAESRGGSIALEPSEKGARFVCRIPSQANGA
jgi:signal transduction histidine kinase